MTTNPRTQLETVQCTYRPLTTENWSDLEELFGPRGAVAGCWCMWWRIPRAQWDRQRGEGNRQDFKAIVSGGQPTGVLAYRNDRPVGWCAVAPRDAYPTLNRSKNLSRIDDRPVWSITCFFIHKGNRRNGLMKGLIQAAMDYARGLGAETIEAYPKIIEGGHTQSGSLFTGVYQVFLALGFVEITRRSAAQPLMRFSWTDPLDPQA